MDNWKTYAFVPRKTRPRRNLNSSYAKRNLYRLFNIFPKFPKEYIKDIYGSSQNILTAIDSVLNRQNEQLVPVIINNQNEATILTEPNEHFFNYYSNDSFSQENRFNANPQGSEINNTISNPQEKNLTENDFQNDPVNKVDKLKYYSGGGIIKPSTTGPDIRSTYNFINYNSMLCPNFWSTYPNYPYNPQINPNPYNENHVSKNHFYHNPNLMEGSNSIAHNSETNFYNDESQNIRSQSAHLQDFGRSDRTEEYRNILPQFYEYFQPLNPERNVNDANLANVSHFENSRPLENLQENHFHWNENLLGGYNSRVGGTRTESIRTNPEVTPASYLNGMPIQSVNVSSNVFYNEGYLPLKRPIKKDYSRQCKKMNNNPVVTIDLTNDSDSSNDSSNFQTLDLSLRNTENTENRNTEITESIIKTNLENTYSFTEANLENTSSITEKNIENTNSITGGNLDSTNSIEKLCSYDLLSQNEENVDENEIELRAREDFLNTLDLHPIQEVSSKYVPSILRKVRRTKRELVENHFIVNILEKENSMNRLNKRKNPSPKKKIGVKLQKLSENDSYRSFLL